jgi:adenylate cyclase class IV
VPTERELKLPVPDLAGLRRRLAEAGATATGVDHEINLILDSADHKLLTAGCGLRVRRIMDGDLRQPGAARRELRAILTFKGPRAPGAYKEREELETGAGDAATLLAVLARLGYRPVLGYEKRRQKWALGACEVALDEVPVTGSWVEIEGPSAAAIEAVRTELGLEDVAPDQRTYVQMAAEHGTPDADGVRWLRFS